ncbi:MAG: N-acetyl-gamma-glutamyl-phosphate reductase [Candidatus Paceibacterota bacterium]
MEKGGWKPKPKIFIDGAEGTTALEIRERLKKLIEEKGEIEMVFVKGPPKDPKERSEAMEKSDLVVLCLPDDAAKESVAIANSLGSSAPKILDASTAHRIAQGWVYGFPEMDNQQSEKIKEADAVSNPGCYATGAIALLRPLVQAGVIPEDYPITINAMSGYSGGGKKMIEAHNKGTAPNFELYGLDLEHKHIPEIQTHSQLKESPIFIPSVGGFPQGMLVSIPLHLKQLPGKITGENIAEVLRKHYAESNQIKVILHPPYESRLNPEALAKTDKLDLHVFWDGKKEQAVLVASLDNLGKGAAGAAVQNIELMLGLANQK